MVWVVKRQFTEAWAAVMRVFLYNHQSLTPDNPQITYGGEYLRKVQKANAELGSPVKEFIVIGDGKEDKGDGLYGFSDIVKSTDISAFPKVKIDPSNDVAILPYRCVPMFSLVWRFPVVPHAQKNWESSLVDFVLRFGGKYCYNIIELRSHHRQILDSYNSIMQQLRIAFASPAKC
jgi:hypothetical protein